MDLRDPISAIDRYTVERLLGVGAMGRVYLAYDTKLHRRVALKVLSEITDRSGEVTEIALREARSAAALTHPNAAAIYDAGWHGELAFIVMEYVPGVSLRNLIGDASVPLAARLRWLVEIASALTAAHVAGVVHRDVKPDNVLVREDGLTKVLDFGIARPPRREDEGADAFTTWSARGDFVGTPGYMAPEVIRGGEVDGRADQFGWGVLAFELLSGKLPWRRAETPFGAIASVLTDTPPLLGGEVPPDVTAAIARAMAKSPDARFPSLAEAATALAPYAYQSTPLFLPPPESILSSAPPTPKPPPLPEPAPAYIPSGTLTSGAEIARALPSSSRPPPPSAPVTPRSPELSSLPAYRSANFNAPVDLGAHLALLPPTATCKGMFFLDQLRAAAKVASPIDLAMRARIPDRRYIAFRDYPMADLLRLSTAVARALHPAAPLGEALRRLGQRALSVVTDSHIGRTIFGAFGKNVEPFLLHAPRAFRLLISFGEASGEKLGPGEFIFRVRDMPLFLESYGVGILEGILRHCHARGEVQLSLESLAHGSFKLRLERRE